jgi:protein AroM
MPRLGAITVGQSPRSDIMPYMTALLGPEIEVVESGALDGMSPDELSAMTPEAGEHSLATRLADGAQIVISHNKVVPLVQGCITRLNRQGVDLILLLCTGQFPEFKSRTLVIAAQKIVDHTLEAVLGPENTLGLFVPLPEQAKAMADSLKHITPKVKVVSASPYLDTDRLREAALEMAAHGPDLTVLHCMGYNETHREIMAGVLDTPSLVANSMVARTLTELLRGKAMAAKA